MYNSSPTTTVKNIVLINDFNLMQREGHQNLVAYGSTLDGADTVIQCKEEINSETCGECRLRNFCKSSKSLKER